MIDRAVAHLGGSYQDAAVTIWGEGEDSPVEILDKDVDYQEVKRLCRRRNVSTWYASRSSSPMECS